MNLMKSLSNYLYLLESWIISRINLLLKKSKPLRMEKKLMNEHDLNINLLNVIKAVNNDRETNRLNYKHLKGRIEALENKDAKPAYPGVIADLSDKLAHKDSIIADFEKHLEKQNTEIKELNKIIDLYKKTENNKGWGQVDVQEKLALAKNDIKAKDQIIQAKNKSINDLLKKLEDCSSSILEKQNKILRDESILYQETAEHYKHEWSKRGGEILNLNKRIDDYKQRLSSVLGYDVY